MTIQIQEHNISNNNHRGITRLMSNRQLKERIDRAWNSLKRLKASDVEHEIELSREVADRIVGVGEIQKIRNCSLLKYFIYDIIAFVEEGSSNSFSETKSARSYESAINQDRIENSISRVKELQQIMEDVLHLPRNAANLVKLDLRYVTTMIRKVNSIEEDLREESVSKKFQLSRVEDVEGSEAMIEQLETLLKKKEGRIKELNNELEFNFNDKEELELEIEALEDKNIELEEIVKQLEEECNLCKDDFEKYRLQQKQELLFGASEFMNSEFPHKQTESTEHEEEPNRIPIEMLNSSQLLSRYCKQPHASETVEAGLSRKETKTERKTTKKSLFRQIEEEGEENLLQSIRIFGKKSDSVKVSANTEEHSMQRMLLAQAAFIERAMESILN